MRGVVEILCFVCLRGAVLDLEKLDFRGYLRVGPLLISSPGNGSVDRPIYGGLSPLHSYITCEVNTPDSGGNVYEKPVGKCYTSGNNVVDGCRCNTKEGPFMLVENNVVFAAVCISACITTKSCPKPPGGSPECYVNRCFVNCASHHDCPESGICVAFPDPRGNACMYKN
ncbi:hypothetical protein FOZ60_008769 [Perkinsus olseni]|uniref:Uncharacterized protein n=1 Tax=Perkinsus olseni TaxID=32597 RepID=A0A7J6NIG3_PEROL|nr:hypothetical protein FOZ60_008769 [Perkinsus olseni]